MKEIVCLWDERKQKFVFPLLHIMDEEKMFCKSYLLKKNVCIFFTFKKYVWSICDSEKNA